MLFEGVKSPKEVAKESDIKEQAYSNKQVIKLCQANT